MAKIKKIIGFSIIDTQTNTSAELEKIALKEEWAKDLMYCDMEGFAITESGDLILLDECGKYAYCPTGRFSIEIKIAQREYNDWKANQAIPTCARMDFGKTCSHDRPRGHAANALQIRAGQINAKPHGTDSTG